MRVHVLGGLVVLVLVAGIAAAQEAPSAAPAPAQPAPTAAAPVPAPAQPAPTVAAPAPRPDLDDDDLIGNEQPPVYHRPSQWAALRSGIGGILLLAAILWVLVRSQGSGAGGGGWGTYYLAWLVVPMVIALVAAYPLVLVVVAVGLIARPWLPDPVMYLRHARRAAALETQVRSNPSNMVAHRDLAEIWLAKRRPRRALAHLEIARAREPDDLELRLLEGQSHAQAGRQAEAAVALLEIGKRDPKFRYGEAALGAADALIAQREWAQAEPSLRAALKANSSSVEAHVKLAKVRARQGDAAGATAERRAARQLYGELPAFQRKRQRYWYLRALVGL